jgi:hypothetical protein
MRSSSIKRRCKKKFQGSSFQFQEETEDFETEEARKEAASSIVAAMERSDMAEEKTTI